MNLDIIAPAQQLLNTFVATLPTVLTFIAVLVVGLILAPIVEKITRTLVQRSGLETLLERLGAPKLLYRVGYKKSTAHLLGGVVRLHIYLFTALIAADVANLSQISRGLDALVAYLPHLAVAIVFLMVGFWAADMIRGVVATVAKKQQGQLIGNVIYYGVVAITIALVADQLGLETALINQIIVLLVAGVIFSAALALGLSARNVLSNLLARNYVAQLYPRGDNVYIDDVSGIVKGHSPTALVLIDGEDVYNIPYIRFMETTARANGPARPVSRNPSTTNESGLDGSAEDGDGEFMDELDGFDDDDLDSL